MPLYMLLIPSLLPLVARPVVGRDGAVTTVDADRRGLGGVHHLVVTYYLLILLTVGAPL